jgi:hypothetical protein
MTSIEARPTSSAGAAPASAAKAGFYIPQLVILDDEQRRRARVREIRGISARAAGRIGGDGRCCRSFPDPTAERLSGDPGLELLVPFKLGGHRVGLVFGRVLAHAHAVGPSAIRLWTQS